MKTDKVEIEEKYISFETAKMLNEFGFDNNLNNLWYDENGNKFDEYHYDISRNWRVKDHQKVYQCPTLEVVNYWLKDKYHLHISVIPAFGEYETMPGGYFEDTFEGWQLTIYNLSTCDVKYFKQNSYFKTYESGFDFGIKYCLENLI